MSHNLHVFHVFETNAKDAMNSVEFEIESWGNENNWRTILYAINRKGKITKGEYFNNRFDHWEMITFENINSTVRDSINSNYWIELGKNTMDLWIVDHNLTESQWFCIEKYAQIMGLSLSAKDFDIDKNNEFNEWQLDEFGVTNLLSDPYSNPKEYLVVVDMHS